jgi:hypothetical protein
MKYVKKSGHGVEWVRETVTDSYRKASAPHTQKYICNITNK